MHTRKRASEEYRTDSQRKNQIGKILQKKTEDCGEIALLKKPSRNLSVSGLDNGGTEPDVMWGGGGDGVETFRCFHDVWVLPHRCTSELDRFF
jgi:hypothetical protein